jgi:hypothetical protein
MFLVQQCNKNDIRQWAGDAVQRAGYAELYSVQDMLYCEQKGSRGRLGYNAKRKDYIVKLNDNNVKRNDNNVKPHE